MLGVGPTATKEELRRAYLRCVSQYHPDKVATLGPDLQQLAEEKTKQIDEAYSVLAEMLVNRGRTGPV